MALVIVLAFLVLLTGLTVAFFSLMTGEATQSATYLHQVQGQQLADSAMNLVTGQIVEATKGFKTSGSGTPDYSAPLAWTSQPGAIRTFDNTGAADNVFKLYSARRLVATASEFTSDLGTDVPGDWASKTALFTDLNAPVNDASGNAVYPIADPRAVVEGFSVTGAPTANSTNTLPMPAQWLYVLQDGTITSPDSGTGGTATFTGTVPTSANPIVGRIAYWADDETTKVNINTASEGTFWDTPRAVNDQEVDLGKNQPVTREFQRFPGHPAMVSLAPVLFATSNSTTPALSKAQRDALYDIAPRVNGGGSDAGTVPTTTTGNTTTGGIPITRSRIYSHVDELIFNDARAAQNSAADLTKDKLEQSRFFLTANSRAPETTLFNTPRVAMWPLFVTDDDLHRTPFDKLIAFCSTIGDPLMPTKRYPFYFARQDPKSMTVDFPGAPTLTPQTGLGRNRNLYAYLQNLTSRQIPGFGGNFASKYSFADERDQILTGIFDFIRLTNQEDSSSSNPNFVKYGALARVPSLASGWLGHNQIVPIQITANGTKTNGFGRFPTITEAGIHFICSADGGNGTAGGVLGSNVATNKTLGGTLLTGNATSSQRRIEAMLAVETFMVAGGYPPSYNSVTVRVRGLDQFTVKGTEATATNLGFPSDGLNTSLYRTVDVWGGRSSGGLNSNRQFLMGKYLPARGVMPRDVPPDSNAQRIFPFVSAPVTITVDPANPRMTVSLDPSVSPPPGTPAGSILVEVYVGPNATASATPIRTKIIPLATGTFPAPNLAATGPRNGAYTASPEFFWTFSRAGTGVTSGIPGRIEKANSVSASRSADPPGEGSIFAIGDVIRTSVPAHGDYRILAADGNVDFVPIPTTDRWSSADPTGRLYHTFGEGSGSTKNIGASYAKFSLVDGILSAAPVGSALFGPAGNYSENGIPDVPIYHANSNLTGDWDNGIGFDPDGAYINMPDEGNNTALTNVYGLGIDMLPYFDNTQLYVLPGQTFFSPNRAVPSSGMLGSLPTGVKEGVPFRTLLFRPQPGHPSSWKDALGNQKSGNAGKTPDHLITDLFWMPVVEPYAISEPFSTAGKINLNYAIAPYSYIRRATGLAALLRSEKIMAIPNAWAHQYKNAFARNAGQNFAFETEATRFPLDTAETLKQFDAKFTGGDVFKSASEICDIHLIPGGTTITLSGNSTDADSVMANYWSTRQLTGDNTKERPYTNLLGRLTTKSNTFTIHYKVQVLRQRANSPDFATWEEGKDQVLAEYRGSTIIERYIDPNDTRLPDFATETDQAKLNIDNYYRIRTVATKRFAP